MIIDNFFFINRNNVFFHFEYFQKIYKINNMVFSFKKYIQIYGFFTLQINIKFLINL